ncbi:MAG: hypothetical protein HT580_16875 [Dechloromonas sp.]|nr:MAG: hypothetical protein HT580_16875 [Dechloromonas sp.]
MKTATSSEVAVFRHTWQSRNRTTDTRIFKILNKHWSFKNQSLAMLAALHQSVKQLCRASAYRDKATNWLRSWHPIGQLRKIFFQYCFVLIGRFASKRMLVPFPRAQFAA